MRVPEVFKYIALVFVFVHIIYYLLYMFGRPNIFIKIFHNYIVFSIFVRTSEHLYAGLS